MRSEQVTPASQVETITFRLPAVHAQAMRQLAAASDRRLAAELRRAVREYLAREQLTAQRG